MPKQLRHNNSKMKKQLIKKDMLIGDIVEKYPQIVPILQGYGLHCVGCVMSGFDTLENGVQIHGMDKETFNMLLKDINSVASKTHNA